MEQKQEEQLKAEARQIFAAAVAAVSPRQALQRHLRLQGDILQIREVPPTENFSPEERGDAPQDREHRYDLSRFARILVLAVGKAGAAMALALEETLEGRIDEGLALVKYGHSQPPQPIHDPPPPCPPEIDPRQQEDRSSFQRIHLHEAGHPVPDEAGLEGARQLLRLAQETTAEDLVFCLLSGGASALAPLPAPGLTLAHKQETTRLLLSCGATIHEVNAIRKHLSALKGGQLARHLAPATSVTLILSDVIGDPLDAIASGPTVPDPSTFADCLQIIQRYNLHKKLPQAVWLHLQDGAQGKGSETPKADDPLFAHTTPILVGSNKEALAAAATEARLLGYHTSIWNDALQGEASHVARHFATLARRVLGTPLRSPTCLLSGGETTVTLQQEGEEGPHQQKERNGGHQELARATEQKGRGGRNQELALAAALALDGLPGVCLLSAGTDGTDGPTDAAGAFATGQTLQRARKAGLEPLSALATHKAYPFFQALGDLLLTGPTHTNVMDLQILLLKNGPSQGPDT